MQIIGGSRVPWDVQLEADPKFIGETLSIALSQNAKSTAVWVLDVEVQTKQGRQILGQITTVAPSAGDPPARIVGFASCPGATGWRVIARSSSTGDIAEINLASSRGGTSTFGVIPNPNGQAVNTNVNVSLWGGALVAAAQVLADAMTNAVLVPLFGARLEAFNTDDGWNRLRVGNVADGLFDLKVGGTETTRVVHLASQSLPAAGGFTSQAPYDIPSGVSEIGFWVTYREVGSGGYPKFQVLFGNGTEEGQDISIDQSVTPQSFGQGDQQLYLQELLGPPPGQADSAIIYVITVRVPRGATTVRMRAAEVGNTALPGTIAIALTGGTVR